MRSAPVVILSLLLTSTLGFNRQDFAKCSPLIMDSIDDYKFSSIVFGDEHLFVNRRNVETRRSDLVAYSQSSSDWEKLLTLDSGLFVVDETEDIYLDPSISGDWMAVGVNNYNVSVFTTERVLMFERSGELWVQKPSLESYGEWPVIAGDFLMISNRQKVDIFHLNDGVWEFQDQIPYDGTYQITEMAIGTDGTIVLFKTNGGNDVFFQVYETDNAETWTEGQALNPPDGESSEFYYVDASVAVAGGSIFTGYGWQSDSAGTVWVWEKSGNDWEVTQTIVGFSDINEESLGENMKVNGNYIVIGGERNTRLFTRGAGEWSQVFSIWHDQGEDWSEEALSSAYWSTSIGISPTGIFAVMGTPGDDTDRDQIFVFDPELCAGFLGLSPFVWVVIGVSCLAFVGGAAFLYLWNPRV